MNLVQILINGLITSGELGIIAIGLTMTFAVLRFGNFAHTEMAVIGAYATYACNVLLHVNLGVSMLIASLVGGVCGLVLYLAVFRVFRGRGDVPPMIASLGVAIALRNTIQAIFGPQIERYNYEILPGIHFLGGLITGPQLGILAVVPVAMLGFHVLLQYTKVGKAMRATAADADLAQASGIDTDRIIRLVWFIGSGFAALGGALVAWDTQLDPLLGFNIVIPVFCCVLIGGVGSVYGAMLGALIVGVGQNFLISFEFGAFLQKIGIDIGDLSIPTSYKPAVVYAAVILILLFNPRGIMRKEA